MSEKLRQRTPRLHDRGYLNWLQRQACCCGCSRPAPSDPAHVKSASEKHGKPSAGTMKPDDCWALPLHRLCHDAQHAHGDELDWWRRRGIDPFEKCVSYYRLYRALHPNAKEPSAQRPAQLSRIGRFNEFGHKPVRTKTTGKQKIAGRPLPGTKASGVKRGFNGEVTKR